MVVDYQNTGQDTADYQNTMHDTADYQNTGQDTAGESRPSCMDDIGEPEGKFLLRLKRMAGCGVCGQF